MADENLNIAITATTDQLQTGMNQAGDAVSRYTTLVSQQMAQIRAETAAADSVVTSSAKNMGAALQETATISGGVAREFGVLTSEAMRGNFTRMEGSVVTLANRMGLMQEIFSGTGLSIIAFVGAGALLVDWAIKGAMEANALNNAIIETGNFAGVTASSVEIMSASLVGGATTITTAKEALAELVSSGKFTADEMPIIGQAVVDMAAVTGKSVKDVVSEFEKLRESPVDAATKLDETLHFLSESTLQQAISFQSAGDKADAFSTIITALAENVHTKSAQMVQDAGYVETAINRWEQGYANIKNFVFDWGKPATDLDKLSTAVTTYQKDLETYQIALNTGATPEFLDRAYNALVKEREAVELLQGAYNAKNAAAANLGQANAAEQQSKADATAFDKEAESLAKQVAIYGGGHVAAVQYAIDQKVAAESVGMTSDQIEALRLRLTHQADAALTNAQALDQMTAAHKHVKEAVDNSTKTLQALDDLLFKSSEDMGDGGAYGKSWNEYINTVHRAVDIENNFIGTEGERAVVEQRVKEITDQASASLRSRNDAITASLDVTEKLTNAFDRQVDSIKGATLEQEIEKQYLKDLAIEQAAVTAAYGKGAEVSDEMKASLHDLAAAQVEQINSLKESEQILRDWQQIATNAFDSAFSAINKDIIEGGSVMKDLVNVAKTVVEQILLEFEKLAIINPLLNQIFGLSGTPGQLPTSSIGGIFNNLGGLLGGGGGNNAIDEAGVLQYQPASSGGGGILGGLSLGGLLAGIGAGAGEFGAAGGGAGGLAGGVAYGVGAYALTGALTAGVTAAAAGGISAGLAAGFAAIPVVGWIGLAAMGINMLTGGGLFGTAAKPYGSEENLSVGEGGANITAAIDEKGKKAFFGGSYWKTVNQPVDQATQDAVAAFFTGLQNAATAEAAAFGQSTATIVTGSFHETFDKAGKMLTETSTVAGEKFTESIQDFQNRLIGDTLLANMGDASAEAQAIAEKWQKSASDLLAGAEFLSQAELDISKGHALAEGDTLTQLTAFVQGMAAQGETLIQTYVRLGAETTDVQAILHNLGLDTGKTGEALVKFDDDMVKAAGGLQNLNTMWNSYYTEFYSQSEQQAITLKNLQAAVTTDFAGIGQDPTESMAQFRSNFESMLSSLTPEEIIQWLAAGDALFKLNDALGKTQTVADAAAQSGQKLYDSLSQGADALKKLESDAASLSATLFGTGLDQLKAQRATYANSLEFLPQTLALDKQIAAMEQQQEAAKHLQDASTLLTEFAQIGAYTGQSLNDIAAQFSTPLDQLASFLGTDANGLAAQFTRQEAIASASLLIQDNTKLTAEYLADIVALMQGGAAPFSAADLTSAASGTNVAIVGAKPGASTATPHVAAPEVVTAIDTSTIQQSNNTDRLAAILHNIEDALRYLSATSANMPPTDQRNFRNTIVRMA